MITENIGEQYIEFSILMKELLTLLRFLRTIEKNLKDVILTWRLEI